MGKIVVPAQDDEIEKWVEGIHQGIIRESQFYKVQKLLNITPPLQIKTGGLV